MNESEKKIIMEIVVNTVKKLLALEEASAVPIGISNKHIHLSKEHVEILFGEGHTLTAMKDVKQPGQFACEETVKISGPKGSFKKVRVLGPERPETQVEVSFTDARALGISVPIRESGVLAGSPGLELEGPCGKVKLDHGAIAALRHIHMIPEVAERLGLKDKDIVSVETKGLRPMTFGDVLVRVSENYAMEMHVDTDEANAAGLKNDDMVNIIVG